jgi:hypothetical protein
MSQSLQLSPIHGCGSQTVSAFAPKSPLRQPGGFVTCTQENGHRLTPAAEAVTSLFRCIVFSYCYDFWLRSLKCTANFFTNHYCCQYVRGLSCNCSNVAGNDVTENAVLKLKIHSLANNCTYTLGLGQEVTYLAKDSGIAFLKASTAFHDPT